MVNLLWGGGECEYIVIDGNSTDISIKYIKEFEHRIDYWVSEPDTGIYNAMNKGVRAARGEFLLFLNSGDTLVSNDTLAKIIPLLDSYIDIYSAYTLDCLEGRLKRSYNGTPEALHASQLFNHTLSHASTFIKRVLLVNRPYDEKYRIVSDHKFFLEAYLYDNIKYKQIKEDVSIFEGGGISCNNDMVCIERQHMLQNILSDSFVKDIVSIPAEMYGVYRQYPDSVRFKSMLLKFNKILLNIYTVFKPKAFKKLDTIHCK